MRNGGLGDLRLVQPREPWPSPRALAAASGADAVVEAARLYPSLAAAVADLRLVYASTARPRDIVKPVLGPREAAAAMRAATPAGSPAGYGCGVVFGPERTGLDNDEVALADAFLDVPPNPAYASPNLAQAVVLVAYEWFQSGLEEAGPRRFHRRKPAATKAELAALLAHLEGELDAAGFFLPVTKRPGMVRNLRNVFTRAALTEQEVRTLHGVVTTLAGRPWRR